MAQQNGLLVDLVGNKLNANLSAKGNLSSLALKMNADSANIRAFADLTGSETQLQTNQPIGFTFTLTPQAFNSLTKDQLKDANATLVQPVKITLNSSNLNIPLKDNVPQIAFLQTNVNLTIGNIALQTPELGLVELRRTVSTLKTEILSQSLHATINSDAAVNQQHGELTFNAKLNNWLTPDAKFADKQFDANVESQIENFPLASVLDSLTGNENLFSQALGQTVASNFNAQYAAASSTGSLLFKLTSPYASATIQAEATPQKYTLSPNSIITYNLQPKLISTIADAKDLELTQPVRLILSIEQLDVDNTKKEMSPASYALGFTLRAEQIIPSSKTFKGISIDNFTAVVAPGTQLDKGIPLQYAAKLRDGKSTANVTGNINSSFAHNKFDQFQLDNTRMTLAELPMSLLEKFASTDGKLQALLGDSIKSITLDTQGDPRKQIQVTAGINSTALNASVGGKLVQQDKSSYVDIADSSSLTFQITPQSFDNYQKLTDKEYDPKTALRIVKPADLTFKILTGRIPLSFAPKDTEFRAFFSSTELALKRGSEEAFFVRNLGAEVATRDLTQKASLDINADVTKQIEEAERNAKERTDKQNPSQPKTFVGKIRSKTTATNLFTPEGSFSLDNMLVDTNTHVDEMPIDLLDQIGGFNGQMVALIGPSANIDFIGQFPGNLDLKVASITLDVPANVNVTRDYILTLREDFKAQLKPTPQTFSELLGKFQPILADAIGSERPITVFVSKEGFTIPITNFQTQKLNMTGSLDLGALRMKRRGWFMQGFTGLFKGDKARRNDNAETYIANFTPLDFVVKNGVATTSEMWLTSSDIAAGFQGKADLNTNKINAVMGLLGASMVINDPALRYAFNPSQIYDVPITGNLDSPNVDYATITANIAGTVAGKQLERHGGDWGKIASDVLRGIGKTSNEERRKKSGFQWHMPEAAQDLVKRAEKQISSRNAEPVPTEQGSTEEKPRKRKNNIGDLLNNLFK